MDLTEELVEFEGRQIELDSIKKKIRDKLSNSLFELECESPDKKAEMIQDTFLSNVGFEFGLSEREAYTITKDIIDKSNLFYMDGTVIGFKYQMINCAKCNCRYSTAKDCCPGC